MKPVRRLKTCFPIGLFMLIALLLSACNEAPQPATAPSQDPVDTTAGVIVCMGDSLTAGYGVDEAQAYPSLLRTRLHNAGHHYQVINAGVSGETSSGALSRLDWMLTLNPHIVILETGANDGLRGVDPALTHRNIAAIVDQLLARDIIVVLAGMQMVRNLGPEFTRAFAAIYTDIAARSDVIFIPFFLEGVAGRADLNQPDGIHPTLEGYRVLVDHIEPFVLQAIARHQKHAAGIKAQ